MVERFREVTPSVGWPYTYRARIETRRLRFRGERHRYVAEQKWVHWDHDHNGRWRKTVEQAVADASCWLDTYETDPPTPVTEKR